MATDIPLRGRRREREQLDDLVTAVRAGQSRALVLRGEPGVGKSALLDYVAQRASGCRVTRAPGVQSEMELAYAGLHQLCAGLLDRLDRLPGPQRDGLRTAFGMSGAAAPDRFLVGLAALNLLCAAAEDRPLVCLVDDAQWLDRASAQVLAFLARRLSAEAVGLVFAVRNRSAELDVLPELVVDGLVPADARALLGSAIGGPIDERVRDRIVAEARGNPLALLELPRGLTPAELAGGFRLPDAAPLAGSIEESFHRRLAALPQESRRLMLVAAAEPVGDPLLLWRAADRIGIETESAAAAESDGLLTVGTRVTFRHPLVRSAIYRAATPAERRDAHRALADATDPDMDPDRRAWHRAHAAAEPDEDVAGELERSAGRAQTRGGVAAAAAFLEHAATLTPDPARRARRALAAAQAKHQAGAGDAALGLVAAAEAGPLTEHERARTHLLRGQIAFASRRGMDAPVLLLEAARRLESLDVRLARDTYLEALSAGLYAGRLAIAGGGVRDAADAARAAPPAEPPRPADLLLDGLAALIAEGYESGGPILKRALSAFRGDDITREEELRWLWLASHAAIVLWDFDSWDALTRRQLDLVRETGALTVLPIALSSRIGVHVNAGEFAAAAALVDEVDAVTQATGIRLAPYGALGLAAWRGREDEAIGLGDATIGELTARGEGMGLTFIEWTTAVLYNGLGRYEDALAMATRANAHPEELWSSLWLHELIEASALSGRADLAAAALESLSQMAQVSGTNWALGVEARSRALLTDGEGADELYREAIERLGRARVRLALARTHLLYGEWLRRENRRADAREQLRTARDMFTAIGAEAYAGRAGQAVATHSARGGAAEASGELTVQEAQIARLARDGLSNPEIGTRLFISPRTVEYHLHKVFAKLDISSRNQLDGVLAVETS
jgi:DNA-binding CsgD family transcriptional regulator